MTTKRHVPAVKAVPLTYWAPSAGNLLSSIVWSLGADLRIRDDAIRILRLVSKSSKEELADVIGEEENGSYRRMDVHTFVGIRTEAIDIVIRCIDAALAPNNAAVRGSLR